MKFLKLKSVILAMVMVCSLSSFKANDVQKESTSLSRCGGIVVNDDIMYSDTDDPSNSIELIVVESDNGEIFIFGGCGKNSCSTDISSLPNGHNYDVSVTTAYCTIEGGFYKN